MAARSPDHARLGEAIRRERIRQGLTLEELAHRAALNPRYVGGVERGEINAATANLLKLVRGLGVTLADVARAADL